MLIIKQNSARCYILDTTDIYKQPYRQVLSDIANVISYTDKNKSFLATKYRNKNWGGDIVTKVSLWREQDKSFPTGLLSIVEALLIQRKIKYRIDITNKDKFISVLDDINPPEWAYEHQVQCIEKALQSKRCVIQSPTGGGKSLMVTWFLQYFKDPNALIVVPKINLAEQLYQTLGRHLPNNTINLVNARNPFKGSLEGITVIVRPSALNLAKTNPDLFKCINILIADECQNTANKSFEQVSDCCVNAEYRIGLSATPLGANNKQQNNQNSFNLNDFSFEIPTISSIPTPNNMQVKAYLGDIDIIIPETKMIESGVIIQPTFIGYKLDILYKQDYPQLLDKTTGKLVYTDEKGEIAFNNKPPYRQVYTDNVALNKQRNKAIVDISKLCLENPSRTGPIIVFIEWQDMHGAELIKEFEAQNIKLDYFINGKTTTKERMRVFSLLRDNKLNLVLATSVMSEGVDIVNLEYAICASGRSSGDDLIQKIGRVVRKSEDKKVCFCIDLIDTETFYLTRAAQRRLKTVVEHYGPINIEVDNLSKLQNKLDEIYEVSNV